MPGEKNTFNLPRGESIRRGLKAAFRDQRAQVLAVLSPRKSRKDDLFDVLPEFPDLELGSLSMSERFTPLLRALWDQGGQSLYGRIGLDPDRWRVVNPHTEAMIRSAALTFCQRTNATTTKGLARALTLTREELVAGVVTRGESIPQLTKRVNAIFDTAEASRARRIAQTEASRAVHAAGDEAARQSGRVAGWQWLLSGDACPLCQTIGRRAATVPLGQAFAVIGDDPVYSSIRYPPLHPHCNCTVVEVLLPAYGGPDDPEWAQMLAQPKPEAEDLPPEPTKSRRPSRRKRAA